MTLLRITALAFMLLLLSCGDVRTPGPSSTLTMTHVSDNGPLVRSAPMVAGLSLVDLEATILGSNRRGIRLPGDCLSAPSTGQCWSEPPSNSLLLALQDPPPGLWGKCSRTQLGDATLSGASVAIAVELLKGICTGAGADLGRYSLYAIPLAALPAALLTITLSNEGQGIDPESEAHFPWKFETIVDLRRPLPASIDASLRAHEVQAAVAAAWDALPGAWDVSEVAARRWDEGVSCSDHSAPGGATSTAGYLVALYYTVNLKSAPWWTTNQAFFRIAGPKVVRCDH